MTTETTKSKEDRGCLISVEMPYTSPPKCSMTDRSASSLESSGMRSMCEQRLYCDEVRIRLNVKVT